MNRRLTCEISDLMPAGRACGDDDGPFRLGANRGKELALADCTRHFVVIAPVAKRTGHAAATRIEIHHAGARDLRQQRLCRTDQRHAP